MSTVIRNADDLAAEVLRRVALCTKALGAETDLGTKVYDGRRMVSDDMIPCCTVIEGNDQPARVSVGTQYEVSQAFVVFAYVPCNPANPNAAARAAIRDIKRAMFTTDGKADPYWQRRIRKLEYRGKDIGPRADGAAFVVAAVEFAVEYVEDLAAP